MAAGSIVISLLLATGSFETDSKRAEKRLQEFEKTAKRVGTAVGVALAGAGTALAVMTKNAIDQADEMSKLATKIGIGTKELSQLAYAAELSDVSMDSLGNAVKRLGQFQVDALKGGKEQLAILKSIGVEAEDAATGGLRNAGDMLRDLADVFAAMPDGANKTALAVKLLGKSGADLIPLLNGGSKALDEFAAKSDAVGYTLDKETGLAAEKFNDTLSEVGLTVDGLWRQSLPELLPKLQDFADLINSEDFRDGFQTIIGGAMTAVGALAKFTATVANTMTFLGEEVAARMHGPSLDDVVRISDRIGRLKETIAAVQNQGLSNPLAIMDASELIPKDFVSTKDTVLKRLQAELDKEENRLEIGYKLDDDMTSAARELVDEAKAAIIVPDFTGGGTSGGGKSPRAKAAEDSTRALRELLDADRELYEQTIANVDVQTDAITAWGDLTAQLEGPTAEAYRNHLKRLQEITELGQAAGATADEIAAAKARETAAYEASTPAMLEAAEAERQAMAESAQLLDSMGFAAEDMFASFIDGSKSASDAFADFAEDLQRIAARLLAQKAITWFLGMFFGPAGSAAGTIFDLYSGADFGFASGGYTGPGGKNEPAGIVHAGEYVINAESTKKLGLGFLDSLNGYSQGGAVVPVTRGMALPAGVGGGAPSRIEIVNNGAPMQIDNVEQRRGTDGQMLTRIILSTVSKGIAGGELDKVAGRSWGVQRVGFARG